MGAESEVVSMFETMGPAANVGGVKPEESIDDVIDRWSDERSSE